MDIRNTTGDGTVTLIVHDTGIGIPAEHFVDLFAIHARYKRLGTAGETGTDLEVIYARNL